MAAASRSIFRDLKAEKNSLANIVSLMCFVKNRPVLWPCARYRNQ